MECLNWSVKVPDEKDKLMMLVIVGTKESEHALRRKVGSGSISQYLLEAQRALVTSAGVTGRISSRSGGVEGGGWCGEQLILIL